MEWLRRLIGSSTAGGPRPTRRITVDRPLVIKSPRIGFFNLLDSSAESILKKIKKLFGLFLLRSRKVTSVRQCAMF